MPLLAPVTTQVSPVFVIVLLLRFGERERDSQRRVLKLMWRRNSNNRYITDRFLCIRTLADQWGLWKVT